jgi:U4/U6 small nuclear ribonucleoprotein PRP31
MKVFAPNLTEIVGSEIAAKLIGAAGSLQTLATMPAQNIQVLGRTKKQLAGFSKAGINKLGYEHDGCVRLFVCLCVCVFVCFVRSFSFATN